MVIPTAEQILGQIKDLSIIEALAYLTFNKIANYAGERFSKVKQVIKDKYNNSHFAFVPNKKEAEKLKEFGDNPDYKTIVLLLPKYRYHDIIRTGLLIKSYLKNPTKENNERTKVIKTQVARRPNGNKLLTIIRLTTTPYFSVVMKELYRLKMKGYSDFQLAEEFDETIIEWNDSHLPVKSSNLIELIESFCRVQVKKRKKKFFLLGIKTAAEKVEEVIEKLEKEDFFKKNNYTKTMIKDEEGVEPRVEVTIRVSTE